MASVDSLVAPIANAEHREIGGIQLDVVAVGQSRVKRMIYPPGFRWSTHMKPVAGTELCMHAHAGFIARGRIHVQYADGCTVELIAPQVVSIAPGHDAWVVGDETAVVIEFDFERDTVERLGVAASHRHDTKA
jgi:hypothetical protein